MLNLDVKRSRDIKGYYEVSIITELGGSVNTTYLGIMDEFDAEDIVCCIEEQVKEIKQKFNFF